MAQFLLELFSEEIPARMQAAAAEQLQKKLEDGLKALGVNAEGFETFVTPRRLAVRANGLPKEIAAQSAERKGPRVGAPDKALEGFLRSTGLSKDQLTERDGVYFAMIETPAKPLADVLPPLLAEIMNGFHWPKSMRWGAHDVTWVRPLKNILCLLDGDTLPFTWAHVSANNQTFGHRFLSPDAITIKNPADYEAALEKAHVLADASKRKALILDGVKKLADAKSLVLNEDEGLLNEVTGLVEWPTPLMGTIDAAFMELPPEVLISEMRAHQKYFALYGKDGKLAPAFITISNMVASDGGKAITAGNERVLRARLADGVFFWEQDRKKTLDAWGEGLSAMTYHAKIGSMAERVERITSLAKTLAKTLGADEAKTARAASLCKNDLTTGMVGEFPELQGVMGRYYAVAQKEDAAVADAIRDHYKPAGANDDVPTTPVSIAVALADKLDILGGMFAIDEKPTGSKDPFALRRAALGIIRIIRENNLRLPLAALLNEKDLLPFFQDRLKVMLRDEDVSADVVDAVLTADADDMLDIAARAHALKGFITTADGKNLLAGYKRATNIVKAEEKKDKTRFASDVDAGALNAPEGDALLKALNDIAPQADGALAKQDYTAAMTALAGLRAPVDAFLEGVMVNDADAKVRENRLKLLAYVRAVVNRVADFDKLQG